MTITAREPDAISYRGLHGLVQAIQTSTHFLSALILSACVLAIPVGVHAQVNPEIANCAELKDEATITQADLCSAHIGCRFVLNVQKTCARAKGYLERLQTAIGEGTRTFFGSYRKEVTPDAVFTAVLNDDDRKNERKLGGLAEPQRRAHEIEARVRDVGSGEVLSGDADGDSKWAYYGQAKDGMPEGIGTRIFSNGEVQRGQFSQNALNGDAEVLSGKGGRFVGIYAKNIRVGQGTYVRPNGSTAIGRWTGNGSMEGTFTRDDGSRFEGVLAGGTLSKGRDYRPDGTLAEEGRYEDGKLSVGTRYDVTGARTEVNLPELARTAQKERIALELARSAAEIEADKLRKREEAARAEQQFRTSLQTLNPGQLFTRADELNAQGDSARAREVQRALMSRFPDHPLAATAARQLAGESSTSSATSSNTTSAAGTRATVPTRGEPSVEMLMSRCSETLKTTIDVAYQGEVNSDRYYGRNHTGSRERVQRWVTEKARFEYATGALAIPPNSLVEYHAGALREAESRIKPMQNGLHDTHREQALLRACLIKARIDSGAVTAGPAASARLSGAQCQAMKQSIMTTRVPPNASVTASTETVMFMTKTVLDMIAGGCPTDSSTPAQIEAERQERQRQYTAAESACNAVQSGGRRCVPRVHTAAEVSRPAVSSAAQNTQQQGAISYDPVTGRCLGEGCCSLPGITGQPQCSGSSRSSGGGIRTAR